MALLGVSIDTSAPIKCPADKFYNFFKYNMSDLITIFPIGCKSAKIIEGQEGTVGCVKQWNYVIGGIPQVATMKIEAIDDDAKSITFVVIEGDLLLLYKSFKATIAVSEGLATWTFTFEKATPLSPPPELYKPFAITMCTLVDAYLLITS